MALHDKPASMALNAKPINVLIVDDDSAIREMVRFVLHKDGMQVQGAEGAREALSAISAQRPDIILMDWMLPGISGLELTRRLRRETLTADIPVIMLTARMTEDDKVAGLEAGCDDYVLKPFSPRELNARINAVLRRASPADEHGRIEAGTLLLDTLARKASAGGVDIHLGPTEYRLLEFFVSNQGRAYSRAQILDHVWGTSVYLEERTVDVHIRRLRQALQATGINHYVQTVRGHGYRFLAEA
jgi:two-component system phosphate regulon response regulator PhoB